ncbi:MAG: MerR family transcriptional regulator [Cytophagaceae bacterium]
MGRYSIKDLEQLSGIKAHTIRIWEQRYNLLSPERTDTNIRFYNDSDLKLILNISLLKEKGVKISRIVDMSPKRISEEVLRLSEGDLQFPSQIHSLTMAMLEINEEYFEKILSTSIIHFGFEKTMLKIIYPFLSRIGFLWQAGTINTSHEHFISNLIRQKIIVAIDGILPSKPRKSFMLFLPEGELHEISLLFACYMIKSRNFKVIYLGQSLPFEDLQTAYDLHKPDYLFSVITSMPYSEDLKGYITSISEKFPNSTVFLSGLQFKKADVSFSENVSFIPTPEDLLRVLEQILGVVSEGEKIN